MENPTLNRIGANHLARALTASILDRCAHIRVDLNGAALNDGRTSQLGPEALHLYTEASVLIQLSGVLDHETRLIETCRIEDAETRENDGYTAEQTAGGFRINFGTHAGIGRMIREARAHQARADRIAALRATIAQAEQELSEIVQ
jgi:hypothetical protein